MLFLPLWTHLHTPTVRSTPTANPTDHATIAEQEDGADAIMACGMAEVVARRSSRRSADSISLFPHQPADLCEQPQTPELSRGTPEGTRSFHFEHKAQKEQPQ
jgi:hypothetical protein